jgi:hypothetical protein
VIPSIDTLDTLEAALKRTRWSVLGLLACCVGIILLRGFAIPDPPPDRWLTSVAVFLALGTIVLSRIAAAPGVDPRRAIWLLLSSLVVSAAIGVLGVFVAWEGGASRTGILFALAGVIFAIRPTRAVGSGRGGN